MNRRADMKPDERPRSRQQRGEREVHAVLQLGQPEERDVHVRTDGDVRHERQVVQPDDAQERREPLVARHRAQLLHASQHGALVAFADGKRLVEQQRQPGAQKADARQYPERHAPVGDLQDERARHRRQHGPYHEHHLHDGQQSLAPFGNDGVLHHRRGHRAHRPGAQGLQDARGDEHDDVH